MSDSALRTDLSNLGQSNAQSAAKKPAALERRASFWHRAAAGFVAVDCLGVLVLAAFLTPSSDGHGTHTQLGLFPCTWVVLFNQPCPTCGMTTAFTHAADGHFVDAVTTQPMGALLALSSAGLFWLSLHVAATGSTLWRAGTRLLGRPVIWGFVAALVLSWAYKIVTWSG